MKPTLTRRQFLFLAAAAGLTLRTHVASVRAQTAPIVVIGAGAAGLAAAQFLRNQRQQVIVLEARDRVGGRAQTHEQFAPFPVELGAELLYSATSAVYDVARRQGLNITRAFESDRTTFLHLNDTLVPPPRWFVIPRINLADDGLYAVAEAWAGGNRGDISLAELLTARGITLDAGLLELVDNRFREQFNAPLAQLGVRGLLETGQELSQDFRIAEGFSQLWARYAQGLDIRFDSVVQQIAWSPAGVTLTTRDETVYEASKVVITLPLAVLQAGDVRFDPPLPDEKQAVIHGLGSGAAGKLLLRFDAPFWPEDFEQLLTELPMQRGWLPGFGRDDTPILTASFGAETAAQYSRLGVDGAVSAVLSDLERVFSVSGLAARVQDAYFADWYGDPFSRMGASYVPVGSEGLREQLAAPTGSVLFWAGEATNVTQPGRIDGAYDSGVRAAREVLGLRR